MPTKLPRNSSRAKSAAPAADHWIAEAKACLDMAKKLAAEGQRWNAVYFHSGFAVELALKAVYLRQRKLTDWPADLRGSGWHDLSRLANACGIINEIRDSSKKSTAFGSNWATAKDWKSENRFPGVRIDRTEATSILNAVANPTSGVLRWLLNLYARI